MDNNRLKELAGIEQLNEEDRLATELKELMQVADVQGLHLAKDWMLEQWVAFRQGQ